MEYNLSNGRKNQNSQYINNNNYLTFLLGDNLQSIKINYNINAKDLVKSGLLSNKNTFSSNRTKITNLKYFKNFSDKLDNLKSITPTQNLSFKSGKKIFNKENLKKTRDYFFQKKDAFNLYRNKPKKLIRNQSARDIKSHDLILYKDIKFNVYQNNNKININYDLKNIKNAKKFPINNKILRNYNKSLNQYINYQHSKKNTENKSTNIEQGISRNKSNRQKELLLSLNPIYIFSKQKTSKENNINFNSIKKENKFFLKKNFFKSKNNISNEKSQSRKIIQLISPQNKAPILKEIKTPINKIRKNILKTHDISLNKKIKLSSINNKEHNMIHNESANSELILFSNEKEINNEMKSINVNNNKEIIKSFNAMTQAGKDKNFFTKINQDYYIIKTKINGFQNFNLFGVLDGHGLYGHLISLFVGKYISESFINHSEIKSCVDLDEIYYKIKYNNFHLINEIFVNAEKELYKEEFDSNFSGTACIIVIQLGEKLICANSGDSRAILIYNEKEQFLKDNIKNNEINFYQIKNIISPFSTYRNIFKDSLKGNFSFSFSEPKNLKKKSSKKIKTNKKQNNLEKVKTSIFCLSNDLKPTLPLEKKRIIENGGKVEKYIEKNGKVDGPYRVWVQDEMYPGLAMSRSIGDFIATSVGVIPNPEIIEYNLNRGSKYMIIASDGIWQFMSNEKVMSIGNQFYPIRDPIDLCNELVEEASNLWDNEGIPTDDITVLVVYF